MMRLDSQDAAVAGDGGRERRHTVEAVQLATALVAVVIGINFYAERITEIQQGTDPSFFSRITPGLSIGTRKSVKSS